MLRQVSSAITPVICRYVKHNQEIVRYGLEILMATALSVAAMATLATFFGYGAEMIIFILFFGTLRMSAGGLHARSHVLCFVTYFIGGTLGIQTAIRIPASLCILYLALLFTMSMILIYFYAPAQTKNRPIFPKERIRFRKRSIKTTFMLGVIIALLATSSFERLANTAMMAVFMESLSLINKKTEEELI